MTSSRERPPEVNPMLKMSIGSIISNPISDEEFLTSEGQKSLYLTTVFIIVDIIITIIIFLQEYDFLTKDFSDNFLPFSLKTFFCILILIGIIILFWMHKYMIAQINRFFYMILGAIYYLVKFILKLIKIINKINSKNEKDKNEDDPTTTDIVFLFVHLLTIIPRFLAFFYCRKYIAKLKRIREIKLEKEHENFVDKIAARIQKGYTRWSNPNASYTMDDDKEIEFNKKQYFDKKEDEDNDNENNDVDKVVLEINGQNYDYENNNEFESDNKDE